MKQRHTIMKYIFVVVVAALSLVISIPLSHSSAQKIELSTSVTRSTSGKSIPTTYKQNGKTLTQPAAHVASVNTSTPKASQTTTPPATVKAVTTPVAVPVGYVNGCASYTSTFEQYNWNVDVAMAICQAESAGNVYAVSSTDDYGLMQLHDEEIFNPYDNIAAAYQKYLVQGWEAWTSYNTGYYTEFL